MNTLTKALLTGAALLIAAPALAQPGHGDRDDHMGGHMMGGGMGAGHMLQRFDTDKDGALSKEEFTAARAENFKNMDPNGDGKITKEEMPAAMERMQEQRRMERAARMFAELDTDKDGTVTQAEFLARNDRMFSRMDRNDDGRLSPDDRQRR